MGLDRSRCVILLLFLGIGAIAVGSFYWEENNNFGTTDCDDGLFAYAKSFVLSPQNGTESLRDKLRAREQDIQVKDELLVARQKVIEERGAEIKKKDAEIVKRDVELKAKDVEIENLRTEANAKREDSKSEPQPTAPPPVADSNRPNDPKCSDPHWVFKRAWYSMGKRELLQTNHPDKPKRLTDLRFQNISDVILGQDPPLKPEEMADLVKEGVAKLNSTGEKRAVRVWHGSIKRCDFFRAWQLFPDWPYGYVMIATMEGENYGFHGTQVGHNITRWGFAEDHLTSGCKKIPNYLDEWFKMLDDPKMIAWFFLQFSWIEHVKLIAIPLGFQDPYNIEKGPKPSPKYKAWMKAAKDPKSELPPTRSNLLEFNFSLKLQIRADIIARVNTSFGGTLSRDPNAWIRQGFNSKFNLCPMGIGMDTYRIVESLGFGMIPVVLTTPMDHSYYGLPVLFVDSFTDVTPEFLERKYLEICNEQNYDFRRLTMEYWMELAISTSEFGTDVIRELHPLRFPNMQRQIRKPGSSPEHDKDWKYLSVGFRRRRRRRLTNSPLLLGAQTRYDPP